MLRCVKVVRAKVAVFHSFIIIHTLDESYTYKKGLLEGLNVKHFLLEVYSLLHYHCLINLRLNFF